MRARLLLCLGAVTAFAACGFPSLQYGPSGPDGSDGAPPDATPGDDGAPPRDGSGSGGDGSAFDAPSSGPDGATSDAQSDGVSSSDGPSPGDDASPDGPSPGDDASPDAPATDTEAPPHDSGLAPDGSVDCDQDKDGYKAMGACGGTDCCDTDPMAHPGQGQFFTSADACGSFDYNCDGKTETEYLTMITCSGLGVTGCAGGPGFTGDPACGASAPYSQCQGSGLGCQAISTMSAQQACH